MADLPPSTILVRGLDAKAPAGRLHKGNHHLRGNGHKKLPNPHLARRGLTGA